MLPVIEGLRAAGVQRADLDRHLEGGRRRSGADRGRRDARQRRDRAARRPGDGRAWSRRAGADCCLMHMLGEPRTMQDDPRYDDVVGEVKAFLERADGVRGRRAGSPEERILLDPGIGFGKTAAHNLELLRRLDELVALGRPVVIGTSRKSFLGRLTGRPDDDRGWPATIATNVLAYERGARVFRVHDVGAGP